MMLSYAFSSGQILVWSEMKSLALPVKPGSPWTTFRAKPQYKRAAGTLSWRAQVYSGRAGIPRALAGKLVRFNEKCFQKFREFVPGRDMKPVHLDDSGTNSLKF